MGQLTTPSSSDINLSPVDRLTVSNSAAGMDVDSAHVIALGENACGDLTLSTNVVALGEFAEWSCDTVEHSIGIGFFAAAQQEDTFDVIGIGQSAGSFANTVFDLVAIGNRAGEATVNSSSLVLIGASAGLAVDTMSDAVGIGSGALGGATGTTDAVAIGNTAGTTAADCIDIICIGHNAGSEMNAVNDVIAMGRESAFQNTFSDIIAIGSEATPFGASSIMVGNASQAGVRAVSLGHGASNNWQGDDTVALGYRAGFGLNGAVAGDNTLCRGSIVIGPGASSDLTNNKGLNVAQDYQFYVGSNAESIVDTEFAYLFGNMETGNLILGNSSNGVNRDLESIGSTNAFKILNGTRGAGSPSGGGFFYVAAGVLHFVRSDGYDATLSPASGQLAITTTAYTNNAAAQAGTLTNAPAAGNPTKWIPINDNGTIRNIPAW